MQHQAEIMQIPQETLPRRIGVLLFPSFSNHCLANAVEPLRGANTLSRRALYDWKFLGLDTAGVASSSGLIVQPQARLTDHPGGDALLVMPSYDFQRHATPDAQRALRAAAARFRCVAGLDTGSWLMAAAGLLDGRRATIHWDEMDSLAEAFPQVSVTPERFVIDGDRIIALCALSLQAQGLLKNNTVVSTIMSNVGLEIALRKHGINLHRSSVGDRYVVEAMRTGDFNLGGEQSGHLIFLDHTTTGDGMLAALQVLSIMQRDGKKLSTFGDVMTTFPQILLNAEVDSKPNLETLPDFVAARLQVENELGETGRVVVRYSGTEAKVRVMVEGPDLSSVRRQAEFLLGVLKSSIAR